MRKEVFDDVYKHYLSNYTLGETLKTLAVKWNYPSGENLRWAFKSARKKQGIPAKNEQEDFETGSSYEEGDGFINVVCASKRMLTQEDIIKIGRASCRERV